MSKHEFMTRLYNALAGLSEQERNDILNDYEEHFRIGLEMGKSEAEIAGALGSPEELAASFADDGEPAAADAPQTESYGDSWHAEADPFAQEAPQYRDYYNPDDYADGYNAPPAYDAAREAGYGDCPPPGYRQPYSAQRSSGATAVLLTLLIFLTIFVVVPVGLGLFFSFFAIILSLAFAAGWFGVAVLVTYGAAAGWLLAGIGLLCLCACLLLCLITYTSGCCKLLIKYIRFFARTASSRRKESV